MKPETLLRAIGEIDEALIEDAAQLPQRKMKSHGLSVLLSAAAVAACLLLLLPVASVFGRMGSGKGEAPENADVAGSDCDAAAQDCPAEEEPKGEPELPLLTLYPPAEAGNGSDTLWVGDPARLRSATPWREEMSLATLPVFKNPTVFYPGEAPQSGSREAMEAALLAGGQRLGYAPEELTVSYDPAPEAASDGSLASQGYARGEGVSLCVTSRLTVSADYRLPEPLPEGTRLTGGDPAQLETAAQYLLERFPQLFPYEIPQVEVSGGDLTSSGEPVYQVAIYEGDGSDAEQMVNYAFRRTLLYSEDGVTLHLGWGQEMAPDCLGEYPALSLEEAWDLLLTGGGLGGPIPAPENVAAVDLRYEAVPYCRELLPWYCFLVEGQEGETLPETLQEAGVRPYSILRVPAVSPGYLRWEAPEP